MHKVRVCHNKEDQMSGHVAFTGE